MKKPQWGIIPIILILTCIVPGCRRPSQPGSASGGTVERIQPEQAINADTNPPWEAAGEEPVSATMGRENPFALLPEEISAQPDDYTGIPEDPFIHSTLPGQTIIRGFFLGDSPQALVEEHGVYRKVKPGDELADGRVVKISSEGVTILYNNGIPVTLRMGE